MSNVMEKRPTTKKSVAEHCIDECVIRRLDNCAYGFVFNKVTWHYKAGCLTLNGCVPTFYLKHVLQELLRKIELVDQIRNNVAVVSTRGLSSTRPK